MPPTAPVRPAGRHPRGGRSGRAGQPHHQVLTAPRAGGRFPGRRVLRAGPAGRPVVHGEDDEPSAPGALRHHEHRFAGPRGGRFGGLGEAAQRIALALGGVPGRLGEEQPEGGVEQGAVEVPGDRPGVVGLPGEQHAQHGRADALLREVQ